MFFTNVPFLASFSETRVKSRLDPFAPLRETMKRNQLIKHLKKHGAYLLREGSRHTIFQKGQLKTQLPRHNEIVDVLARKICKDIDIPFVR
jgi:predicted RNA binding protein YcfA (HicA-like mRNA interferase family)